ncbi:hypothetical protein [Prauserella alba]|uniref:Uncharacterized protein n=1 Tax=Prauserella alba TaxID=176898 RepID=A0ABN1V4W9_9PSEU|nr:hypothetical protein [Prauserella alba]
MNDSEQRTARNPGAQRDAKASRQTTSAPPTTPCTVVWSQGRPYVLENPTGRPRWMGMDRHGRPQALTGDELCRRGWSYHRAR